MENYLVIHQLPHNSKKLFLRYDVDRPVDGLDYCCVWTEAVDGSKDDLVICEEAFYKFNQEHPENFAGHSLSVSDVVEIVRGKNRSFYYCDSFGWTELEKFYN